MGIVRFSPFKFFCASAGPGYPPGPAGAAESEPRARRRTAAAARAALAVAQGPRVQGPMTAAAF
jgi:hypothetical protein